MRRKGERPVAQRLIDLSPASPVVMSIAEGDNWFDAWVSEQCTPWSKLARLAGVSVGRLRAIREGDHISRAEVDALARAWNVSAADLITTLPDAALVVE